MNPSIQPSRHPLAPPKSDEGGWTLGASQPSGGVPANCAIRQIRPRPSSLAFRGILPSPRSSQDMFHPFSDEIPPKAVIIGALMQRFQFHPVIADWFQRKFGSPTMPQEQGWPAIQSGAHTLIAAPTGSGKTLAAFLASLDSLFRLGLKGELRDETQVVYVSPLKALSNDIHKNLEEPLAEIREAIQASEGLRVDVRAEVRTGD